ncbi:phosphotransferase [Brevibacillus ginsengisoli]|uniref:phosphotransferase n=1 Tax=Brevibacillus ginsengisoli TaxID=363854 RepID=UPI003CE7A9C4
MSRFDGIYPILPEYDMFAQSIEIVKEPNVYKINTPYGAFACKKTEAPQGRLRFVTGILRHLQHRGWDGAVPVLYTKYDEPCVKHGESSYYLTPWLSANPFDQAGLVKWAGSTIERLGELHLYTQNYRYEDPRQVEPLIDSLIGKWTMWVNLMEQQKKHAESLTYPSPFDVVFLANYSYIKEMAKSAIESLKVWQEKHQTYAHFRLSLIHGYPHPSHSLMNSQGKAKLVNFDRAVYDTPVRDLTMFYRSFFYAMGDEVAASSLYHQYVDIFPLRSDEVELLASFLQYPERIMRDIEIYYTGSKNWNELTAVRRLEKDLDRFIRLSRWTQRAF